MFNATREGIRYHPCFSAQEGAAFPATVFVVPRPNRGAAEFPFYVPCF